MAPKRRNKVVGSVVKTKVVQETVEVTTAIVADEADQAPPAVEALPTMDASGSMVVHVEVATPDGDTTTDVNVKQQPAKRGRRRRRREEEDHHHRHQETTPPPPEETAVPVALQSQETQDPNEEQQEDEEEASKKKKQQQRQSETEEDEKQPETPRVASERKPRETAKQKNEKGGDGGGVGKKPKQRRRRRRLGTSPGGHAGMGGVGGYKRYVWRVLKQVHPELGVSGRAMQVLDMMMADMFERLAEEAARLSKLTGRATLTSREVQTAVRLVLPGELGKHAISEGVKAISKYMAA